MNLVVLVGNVTRDGEVRSFANGGSVTKFTVATERNFKQGEEWKKVTQFIDCEYYRSVDVKKGTPVSVSGSLENQSWTSPEGDKRYKTVVRVNELRQFGKFQKQEDAPEQEQEELVGAGAENVGGDIPF